MSDREAIDPTGVRLWREGLRARLAGGGRVVLRAHGHSMWPLLRDGHHVVLSGLGEAPVRVGDVVLARGPGGPTLLHRVVAMRPDAALLKGDANPRADGWVPRDHLVARADPGPAPRLVAGLSRLAGPCLARALGRLRSRHFLTIRQA